MPQQHQGSREIVTQVFTEHILEGQGQNMVAELRDHEDHVVAIAANVTGASLAVMPKTSKEWTITLRNDEQAYRQIQEAIRTQGQHEGAHGKSAFGRATS